MFKSSFVVLGKQLGNQYYENQNENQTESTIKIIPPRPGKAGACKYGCSKT